jgi:hypothetical protein
MRAGHGNEAARMDLAVRAEEKRLRAARALVDR